MNQSGIHNRIRMIIVLTMMLMLYLFLPAEAAFHAGKGGQGTDRFITTQEKTEQIREESTDAGQQEKTASKGNAETGSGSTAAVGKQTVCPTPTTTKDTGTGALVWTEGGVTYYQFDGKKYVIKEDWGLHNLTGFSPESTGSTKTRSGVYATSNYTAASTLANLGKIILVRAEGGTGSTAQRNRYDGVYKCEDTGGTAVEYGLSTTRGTPVVDLFFDTAGEADLVSEYGWIYARIYILEEVE